MNDNNTITRAELVELAAKEERDADNYGEAFELDAERAHLQHRGRVDDAHRIEWREHMSRLAESFHAIAQLAGVRPWNADLFDASARRGLSPASKACAQFVLSVWNPDHKWKSGRFDAVASVARWDLRHRRAFAAWARFPWWP